MPLSEAGAKVVLFAQCVKLGGIDSLHIIFRFSDLRCFHIS